MISLLFRTAAMVLAGQLLVFAPAHGSDSAGDGGIQIGKNADYWEARFGGGAFDTGPGTSKSFTGSIINGEFLAPSPGILNIIGSPRPYVGTDIAISDDAIHIVYAGLNWEANLTRRFYLGFSGGGSWNSSKITTSASGTTRNLGSSTLFHLQASAGYDLSSVMTLQIFYNHFSNGYLSGFNSGLESIGARLGLRF